MVVSQTSTNPPAIQSYTPVTPAAVPTVSGVDNSVIIIVLLLAILIFK